MEYQLNPFKVSLYGGSVSMNSESFATESDATGIVLEFENDIQSDVEVVQNATEAIGISLGMEERIEGRMLSMEG